MVENKQWLHCGGSLICSLVLIGSVLNPKISEAAVYYVATTGSDNNSCTTATNISVPKRTINSGIGCLKAGDTLYIRAGTYIEWINSNVPGGSSWTSPTTVSGYSGETVTLQPPVGASWVINLSTGTQQYIIFNNLILDARNVSYDAFKIQYSASAGSGAHHIRLQNSEVKNAAYGKSGSGALGQGIAVFGGSDANKGCCNEFINLKVHNNGVTYFDHGFYVGTANNLIEKCDVYSNAGFGIHLYNGSSGGVDNNTVRYNNSHQNGNNANQIGAGILLSTGQNDLAYDNIVWGNKSGIEIKASGSKVYNNTIYNNTGPYTSGLYIGPGVQNVVLKNNIAYSNSTNIDNQGSNTILSNNFTNNPNFVDVASGNFNLLAGSPAIDTGITVSEVLNDYVGVSRPQGSAYDIGAYEYNAASLAGPSDLQVTTGN